MHTDYLKKYLLVFLFCYALILGTTYTMYVHFDFSHSNDTKSYLKMAEGDFNVNPTHRYRIIIPSLAATLAVPINAIYTSIWPHREENKWPLRLAFFIVNSFFLSMAGAFMFLTCLEYKAGFISSLIGVSAVLTSRWAAYIGGLPLIDSLYILIISLVIFGIKTRSKSILILCIFVGPFAKESFIFIAPLIFFFGRKSLPLKFQIPLYILSGLLVFSTRYFIDQHVGAYSASIERAFSNYDNIIYTFFRIFSLRGLGEMLSVFGVFTLIVFIGLFGKTRYAWIEQIDAPCYWLLVAIIVHIFLSGDAGRMFYLYSPVFAIMCALILDKHASFSRFRNMIVGK